LHFRIFEFWRLSAALLVMIWHFLRFAPPGIEPVSAGLYRLMPLMEMFFMISGFLIMLRYGEVLGREQHGYRNFIVRRLARFYPLYLITLVFFVAVALAVQWGYVHTDDPGRYDFATLPANILLLQAWGLTHELTFNYVAWCMSAEWFCYLALPIIVLAFRWYGLPGLLVLALATIGLLELATHHRLIPFDSWLEANTWGAYRAFADFVLGAFVAMAVRDSRWRLTSHAPGWLVFALSIAGMATQQPSYLIVALLAASMFLAALAERNNPDGSAWLKPLHPVGAVSMGIYLIHPVIEAIFFSVLWRKVVEPMGVVNYYVYWILPIVVTVLVALASARWFEGAAAKAVNAWLGKPVVKRTHPAVVPAE
jgi:peptidoglycan/LPS O-acetylase OafA/YrhL